MPIFGSVLGGLFGGDAPDFPTLAQLLPSSTSTSGYLANTRTALQGEDSLVSSMTPTAEGRKLLDDYGLMRDLTRQRWDEFSVPEYAKEQYGLIKNNMDRSDLVGANRLLEAQAALTGGIGATAGSRQSMAEMAQNQEYNRNKLLFDLYGRGEQRESDFFQRSSGALNNYANIAASFDNMAQRDQSSYFNLAKATNQQAMGQYQADYADYQGDMAFWEGIGAPLDMALGKGISNIMGGGSFFGGGGFASPTAAVSNTPNIDALFSQPNLWSGQGSNITRDSLFGMNKYRNVLGD